MTVRIWNVEDWTLKIILRGHSRGISDICWSPDSQYLASVGDDALVMLWSPLQSTPIRTLKGHTNYVFCVDWSPAGLIATGSFDESVRLWDARTGNCLRAVSAHGDPVTGVSFGPDGTILASSSYDGLVYKLENLELYLFIEGFGIRSRDNA
jgi:COMPASS component SWD3